MIAMPSSGRPWNVCIMPRAAVTRATGSAVADGLEGIHRGTQVPLAPRSYRAAACAAVAAHLQQGRPLARVAGHLEGRLQVGERLLRRVQRGRAFGRGAQRDARLGAHGIGLRAGIGDPVGVEVVGRQHARQLVVTQGLEVARRREVTGASVAARHGAVGDLPDERLDEPVLAALRRARVTVLGQHVPAHQVPEPRLQVRVRVAR